MIYNTFRDVSEVRYFAVSAGSSEAYVRFAHVAASRLAVQDADNARIREPRERFLLMFMLLDRVRRGRALTIDHGSAMLT